MYIMYSVFLLTVVCSVVDEECKSHKFFPEENELKKDKTTDIQIVGNELCPDTCGCCFKSNVNDSHYILVVTKTHWSSVVPMFTKIPRALHKDCFLIRRLFWGENPPFMNTKNKSLESLFILKYLHKLEWSWWFFEKLFYNYWKYTNAL